MISPHTLQMYIILDFDSTIVKFEGLDELAKISLNNHPDQENILQELRHITKLGMNGDISFAESLGKRIHMLQANKSHLQKLQDIAIQGISDSFILHKTVLQQHRDQIYVISGGFDDFIFPVTDYLGLNRAQVIANKFIFDENDNIIDVDKSRFLAQEQGKVKAIAHVGLTGEVIVIGDGFTDYEIKQAGYASKFGVYIENIIRPTVVEKADFIVQSINDILPLLVETMQIENGVSTPND